MYFPFQNIEFPVGNVLTRATHFAHHSFYSKLLLKANIFPALGFSLLLKHDKYLSVMSQGQSLWVCQICSTCVKWMFPHQTGEIFPCHCKAFPKYHHKMGERHFWGQKKTRPATEIPQSCLRHPQKYLPRLFPAAPKPTPHFSSAHHSPSPEFSHKAGFSF